MLARKLLRTEQLAAAGHGLRIEIETESFAPSWNELSARSRRLALSSSSSWLARVEGDRMQTRIAWCDSSNAAPFWDACNWGAACLAAR